MKIAFIVCFLALPILTSCQNSIFGDDNRIEITGLIVNVDGFGQDAWIIRGRQQNYEPINLPTQFKQDSLYVEATVKERTDLATTLMMGKIVEIIEIAGR